MKASRLFAAGMLAMAVAAQAEPPSTAPAPAFPPAAKAVAVDGQINDFLAKLSDPDFRVRESATKSLRAIGKPAAAALKKAANSANPELHFRIERLLAGIDSPPLPGTGPETAVLSAEEGKSVGGGRIIDVTEGRRSTHIEESPGRIQMIVIGLVDGETVTSEYTDTSPDALRLKNPEAGALYARLTGPRGPSQNHGDGPEEWDRPKIYIVGGRIVMLGGAQLGIDVREMTVEDGGLRLGRVPQESRGAGMNIHGHDLITEANGKRVHTMWDLRAALLEHPQKFSIIVERDGKSLKLEEH